MSRKLEYMNQMPKVDISLIPPEVAETIAATVCEAVLEWLIEQQEKEKAK